MFLKRYGIELRDNRPYLTARTVKGKLLKTVKDFMDEFKDFLDELAIRESDVLPTLEKVFQPPGPPLAQYVEDAPGPPQPRPADAQVLVDKMTGIMNEWNNIKQRFRDVKMGQKTYNRHIGRLRNQVKSMMNIPELKPLDEEDLLDMYNRANVLREEFEQERLTIV